VKGDTYVKTPYIKIVDAVLEILFVTDGMKQSFYDGDKCKTIFIISTETQAQNTILANHQCEKHSSSSQSPDEKQHSASQS
jgi:hypothetical protein